MGHGLKISEEEGVEPESVRYNEVTLSLLMFVDGLAAILSKEIPARGDEVGKLLVWRVAPFAATCLN